MTKIKNIHCFGTSFTAGGGFEFECTDIHRGDFLKKNYSGLREKLTQFNFSYPGRLQKILKDKKSNIVVNNLGKQGYGNQRMFRKVYDIINQYDFNPEEHIFLLEFSDFGRKEFFLNDINSYVIFNHWIDWDTKQVSESHGLAKSWYYDDYQTKTKLENLESYFLDFLQKTFNVDEEMISMKREAEFFISYLNKNKINYLYAQTPTIGEIIDNSNERTILFGDNNIFEKVSGFGYFCLINGFTITNETPDGYNDDHCGFIGNELVSKVIFNKINDYFNLEFESEHIDYEYYKNLDKFNFIHNKLML